MAVSSMMMGIKIFLISVRVSNVAAKIVFFIQKGHKEHEIDEVFVWFVTFVDIFFVSLHRFSA